MEDFNYPRPQFRRENYLCLDGEWSYSLPQGETGYIHVPYVYQSKASGIGKSLPEGCINYERTFSVPESWRKDNIRLHFGAVDYETKVYVNGHLVANHVGGQSPFSIDINEFLLSEEMQKLRVEVKDYPYDERIPRGKQSWEGEGHWIFYTPSTGIWQSVWLEPVPQAGLRLMRFTSDVDRGTLEIALELEPECPLPCQLELTASLNRKEIVANIVTLHDRRSTVTLDIFNSKVLSGTHFFNSGLCWSPETPTLFDLQAKVKVTGKTTDTVVSYFGMRKVECLNGRVYLNNHPYTQKLVLDQGYWPEGLLTPPSPEAFKTDIEKAKTMGFNGCRKHEKAEDPRFLYWADQLGFLVWGSMASFYRFDEASASRHLAEWACLLVRDYNHPSIVCWDMLNESWGVPTIRSDRRQQQYANSLYALAHALDGTRPVISNDGWEMTKTDICALHSYQHGGPENVNKRQRFIEALVDLETLSRSTLLEHHEAFVQGYAYHGQPIILSEYGGIALGQGEGWGYATTQSVQEFLADYERLIRSIAASGMFCGFCYTQLTDVEQEKNGLLDAQRHEKVSTERLKEIHELMP